MIIDKIEDVLTEQEVIFKKAYIPKEHWGLCSIDEKGSIRTPNTKVLYENGLVTEWEYQRWLELQKPIPPSEIEILKQEKEVLAQSVYELSSIVELILTGGI